MRSPSVEGITTRVRPSARPEFMAGSVVVGHSPSMQAVFRRLAAAGAGDGPVLVTGENGTGKAFIARVLHERSRRHEAPFIAVRCALFPGTVLESELFGHERGAFAGATTARAGRFERARDGTLFIDDIDTLSPAQQAAVLRVLHEHAVRRVGGARAVPIDVRLVAGSTCDVEALGTKDGFDPGLLSAVSGHVIHLPPLRERREDIPALVAHFVQRARARRGMPAMPVPDVVMQALTAHDWPGNVRELERVCERMARDCSCERPGVWTALSGRPLDVTVAPESAGAACLDVAGKRVTPAAGVGQLGGLTLDEYLRRVERACITSALVASGGNKSGAARLLGIKRSTLGDRIARCGLERRES